MDQLVQSQASAFEEGEVGIVMPSLPILNPAQVSRDVTDVFYGYNHNLKIGQGEFFETKNLTTAYFPMLANRKKRGLYKTLTAGQGLIEKKSLCYVDDGTLYMNDAPTPVTGLSEGEKTLVSMGAYIVIFPDKVYYNTEDDDDYGSLEATYTNVPGTDIVYEACRADGSVYTIDFKGEDNPEEPAEGQTWLTTDATGTMVLRTWSASMGMWSDIPSVYTKITFTSQGDIPRLFKALDGTSVSRAHFKALNGEKIIYALGGKSGDPEAEDEEDRPVQDYIVLIGIVDVTAQDSSSYVEHDGSITIQRTVPEMDFVCECQNRLWGCFYGNDGSKNINEIFCCALGDFKNWSQYLGLSTDSWRGSVGSDGQWTGAINYLGNPTFWKENHVHIVSVSSTGAHRLDEMTCRGVQKGSHKSLQIINETLYYKSRSDVVAWQGGFPAGVSTALGDEKYYDAVAGVFGQRYYISMKDTSNNWQLFTFDAEKNLWLHEDDLCAQCFAHVGDELFCLSDNKIWAMNGTMGIPESAPEWIAETGITYYQHPDKKYLSRYNVRLKMEAGSSMTIFLEYDSSGEWISSGTINISRTGTVTLPIRPRRCDHMRLKLVGTGDVRIFSIAKILEVGSDV